MYKNEKTRVKSVRSYSVFLPSESTNLLRSFAVTVLVALVSISGLFWTAKEHASSIPDLQTLDLKRILPKLAYS